MQDLKDDGKITETGTKFSKKSRKATPKNTPLLKHNFKQDKKTKYSTDNSQNLNEVGNNDNPKIKWKNNERYQVVSTIKTNMPDIKVGDERNIRVATKDSGTHQYFFKKTGDSIYDFSIKFSKEVTNDQNVSSSNELYAERSENAQRPSTGNNGNYEQQKEPAKVRRLSSNGKTENTKSNSAESSRNILRELEKSSSFSMSKKDSKGRKCFAFQCTC